MRSRPIDEAFDVKLPQHEFLARFVVADEAAILVLFAFRILRLRWISGLVAHFEKRAAQGVSAAEMKDSFSSVDLGRLDPPSQDQSRQRPRQD